MALWLQFHFMASFTATSPSSRSHCTAQSLTSLWDWTTGYRLRLRAHQEVEMVAMGNDFMAAIGAMNVVRQLHNRAALVQVKGVRYQGPMLVRSAIQMAVHNVPCAVHTNFGARCTSSVPDIAFIPCFPAFHDFLVHSRSMHVAVMTPMLQLRFRRLQGLRAVELEAVMSGSQDRGGS